MDEVTVVGIDEAGYGPKLGPLVVAATAFRLPARAPALRELLPLCANAAGPVPVFDSKLIWRGGAGFSRLETSVLAFAAAAEEAVVVPDPTRDPEPWALSPDAPTPAVTDPAKIGAAGAVLAGALAEAGVEVLSVRTRTVPVAEYNAEAERMGSKAALNFAVATDLLAPWLDRPGEVLAFVDRHGGRAYYAPLLAERFPSRFPRVVRESRAVSTYRLGDDAEVSVVVDGDRHHLATALASMAATYVRERWMRAFNAWFGARDPDLRPTAGYHQDANRWLRDSASLRDRLGVGEERLVRVR